MIAAIVPAAGRSERMGRPKLILPLGATTVIGRVVASLRDGGAAPVVVVSPPRDAAGGAALIHEAEHAGAVVVVPDQRPVDMRASFELGLARLTEGPGVRSVLLAPADSPGITPGLVARVVRQAEAIPSAIVIPTYQGRRGHPIALPWKLAVQARALPHGAGLNALVALHESQIVTVDTAEPGALDDLDTPDDYERLLKARSTPVRLTVRLFAMARQTAGRAEMVVELPTGATVATLRAALVATCPELAPLMPNVMIAVDAEYAADDHVLEADSDVAVIPPVSGGSPAPGRETRHCDDRWLLTRRSPWPSAGITKHFGPRSQR